MAMSIVLRKEDGSEIDRSQRAISQRSLAGLARQIPMLRWLDAYGDTVYNGIQRREMVYEIRAVDAEDDDDRAILMEILRLCESAEAPHRYLWFIGD